MRWAAGVLGIAFALAHGLRTIGTLKVPVAPQGSHEPGAIPVWAQILWLLFAASILAGSVAFLFTGKLGAAIDLSAGAVGIWALAIANGMWIHGRPTMSHHIVRGAIVAILIALAFAGVVR